MDIKIHQCPDNSYVMMFKASPNAATYFIPCERLECAKGAYAFFPSVETFDQYAVVKNCTLFKPHNTEIRSALQDHNIKHYSPSKAALSEGINLVDALECSCREAIEMSKAGFAFKSSPQGPQ